MSLKKRIVAACSAVVMACSLVSCGKDTSYIMKADGKEIASGVYINLMLTEYTNQLYNIYYAGEKLADTFEEQKVEGKLLSEFLEDYAYQICLEIVAVEKKCKELGITLTEDEKKEIDNTVDDVWEKNEDYYKYMGVSKESLTRIHEYSTLMVSLFGGLYYEGGAEEVSLEDVTKYVNDNFLRFKMIQIKIETDKEEEAEKLNEKYMGLAEEGKTMDELLELYAKEGEEEEEDEATDDETTDDEASDDEATDDEATDDEATDDEATDDEASDDEASDDEATEEEEEEKTPSELESEQYPNEIVRNSADVEDDKFIEFVTKLEYGEISSYKDEKYYYIVERLDMSERTQFPEANREGVVSLMKTDEYEALLKTIGESMKIEKNEKSFERYNAVDVFKRQDKWYDKNS